MSDWVIVSFMESVSNFQYSLAYIFPVVILYEPNNVMNPKAWNFTLLAISLDIGTGSLDSRQWYT